MTNNFNQQHCSDKNCTLTKEQFEQLQKYIGSLEYGQNRFYETEYEEANEEARREAEDYN